MEWLDWLTVNRVEAAGAWAGALGAWAGAAVTWAVRRQIRDTRAEVAKAFVEREQKERQMYKDFYRTQTGLDQ